MDIEVMDIEIMNIENSEFEGEAIDMDTIAFASKYPCSIPSLYFAVLTLLPLQVSGFSKVLLVVENYIFKFCHMETIAYASKYPWRIQSLWLSY